MSDKKTEKQLKKLGAEAAIESSHKISDVPLGNSVRPIFFTRIKYKSNNNLFLDIRQFSRAYDENGDEVYYPTKIGFRIPEDAFHRTILHRMIFAPSEYLHTDIMKHCQSLLREEKYDTAVAEAFKLVEIAIRKKARLKNDDHGIQLIRKAFHTETGMLTDKKQPMAEREALMHYISGAYGIFRNPSSHRKVEMTYNEAFERIVVASNILKIVENIMVEDSKNPHKNVKSWGLSARITNSLLNNNIKSLEDLMDLAKKDILLMPGIGCQSLTELEKFLARKGLTFADE